MRPPLSAIEPLTREVSMRTRGDAASAASRVRVGGSAGWRWRCTGPLLLGMLLRLLLLDLLLLLHLRDAEIDLPSDQDERGEHDGEDGILLIVHLGARSRRRARL